MYLIGFLSGEGVNFLLSFACSFGFVSSGWGMSGKDSSESISGSVLKSVKKNSHFLKNVLLLY